MANQCVPILGCEKWWRDVLSAFDSCSAAPLREVCSATCQGGERWRHRHPSVEVRSVGPSVGASVRPDLSGKRLWYCCTWHVHRQPGDLTQQHTSMQRVTQLLLNFFDVKIRVTSSDALVPSSDALVPSSDALVSNSFLSGSRSVQF